MNLNHQVQKDRMGRDAVILTIALLAILLGIPIPIVWRCILCAVALNIWVFFQLRKPDDDTTQYIPEYRWIGYFALILLWVFMGPGATMIGISQFSTTTIQIVLYNSLISINCLQIAAKIPRK